MRRSAAPSSPPSQSTLTSGGSAPDGCAICWVLQLMQDPRCPGRSNRRQGRTGLRRGKGMIELGTFGVAEYQCVRGRILLDAPRIAGLGNADQIGCAHAPGDRDLRGTRATRAPESLEQRMARKAAATQRRVGHRENGMLALPGQQIELDAARLQAVEELIALRGTGKSQARLRLTPALQILQREVADPKVTDEPAFAQLRQRPQGLVEWMRPGPVQQVQIQVAAAQALDRVLAGTHRAAQRCVRGLDLTDEKQ